jgi:hypothetical protein
VGERNFKAAVAACLALVLSSAPALACADDEATLFSCLAKDKSHTIELCAVRDDAAGGFQSLQYRYGTAEKAELVFPENRDEGRAAMSFAHAFDGNAYVWSLRFSNKGYTYRLFGMGDDAGVEVWRKKKRLTQVMCGERPYAMAADIRKAAACDLNNPFGKDGCGEVPPQRK